jgi:hypothetical protein
VNITKFTIKQWVFRGNVTAYIGLVAGSSPTARTTKP